MIHFDLIPAGSTLLGLTFYGGRGKGKSLSMVLLAWICYKTGWEIHSNIRLGFPYKKIETTNFHKTITPGLKPIFIILDDLASGTKQSLHEAELNKVITLLRKLAGERVILCTSTPQITQYSNTVRMFTDYFLEPELLLRKDNRKPYSLKIWMYKHNPDKYPDQPRKLLGNQAFYGDMLGRIADLYNTGEAPKTIVSGEYEDVWESLKKYAGNKERGLISMLTEKIKRDHGCSESRARHYARCVQKGYDPY